MYAQWDEIKVATPSNVIINTGGSTIHPTASVQSNTSNTLSSQSTTNTQTNNSVYSHNSGITSNIRRLHNEDTTTQSEILENLTPENIETIDTPFNSNQDNILNTGRSRRTGRSRASVRRYTTTNNNNENQNIDVQEVAESEDANLVESDIVNQNSDVSKNLSGINSNDVIETPGKKNNSSNNVISRFFNWLFKSPVRTVFCLAIFIIAIMIPFIFVILLRRKKKEEDKVNEQIHK